MGNLRDIRRWGDRIITRKVVNLAAIANFASQSKHPAFLPTIPNLVSMSFQLAESQSGAVVVFIVLVRVVVVL